MPRTILDKPKHSKLYILLNGATASLTREELGVIIGCCAQTARERMRRPEDLPIKDLYKICRNLHIPLDELRQAITY